MKKNLSALVITLSVFFVAAALCTLLIPHRADGSYAAAQTKTQSPYIVTAGAESAVFDLNSSGYFVLCNIPYIGNKASDIIALRDELGFFTTIEQIALIDGIGLKTYLKTAAYIRAD